MLKILAALGVAFPTLSVLKLIPTVIHKQEEREREWPVVKVSTLKELSAKKQIIFMYPLKDIPNVLIKLGIPVEFGVGPEGDIVAFNLICQHLGCMVRYVEMGAKEEAVPKELKDKPVLYCPCHAAVYDVLSGGRPVAGPPKYNLPRVLLRVEEEDIIAYGMTPPVIYGKGLLGSEDVKKDLYGGVLVGEG